MARANRSQKCCLAQAIVMCPSAVARFWNGTSVWCAEFGLRTGATPSVADQVPM